MKPRIAKAGKSFRGALNYAMAAKKRAQLVGGNMAGLSPRDLAREFSQSRDRRPDIEKPVFHCSLSLADGEQIDAARWSAVTASFIQKMGFRDGNQWVGIQHGDTDHDHAHIIASRIALDGKIWNSTNDRRRALAACAVVESELGLRLTFAQGEPGPKAPAAGLRYTKEEAEKAARQGRQMPKARFAAMVDRAVKGQPSLATFVDRLKLSGIDVTVHLDSRAAPGEQKIRGLSFASGSDFFSGSQISKKFAWKSLSARLSDEILTAEQIAALVKEADRGPGGVECSGEAARKAFGKQRAWAALNGSGAALPPDLLAAIRRVDKTARTVYLNDGNRVIHHSDGRLTTEPEASDLAIRLMIEEGRSRGWSSVNVTGDERFKLAAAMALTEAGLTVKNPELQKFVNSVRRSQSAAEASAGAPGAPTFKETKPKMDTDSDMGGLAPRPKFNLVRPVERGARPKPAKPVDFDAADVRQLYLRQHYGQAWPPEQVDRVRFVRRMREESGVDIILQTGAVIADRDDGISLAKGEIDQAGAEAIVFAARERGWTVLEIAVGAEEEFKQQIVDAAARQGVEVTGLSPELQARYDAARDTAIEADRERRRAEGAAMMSVLTRSAATPLHRPVSQSTTKPAEPEADRRSDRDRDGPGM